MVLLTQTPALVATLKEFNTFHSLDVKAARDKTAVVDRPDRVSQTTDGDDSSPIAIDGADSAVSLPAVDRTEPGSRLDQSNGEQESASSNVLERHPLQLSDADAPLFHPQVGAAISHGQILDLYKHVRSTSSSVKADEEGLAPPRLRLPDLLRGSKVYNPPPPPKPEPSSEYKQLMARLKREEEQASYSRMVASATGQGGNPFARYFAPSSLEAWDLGSPSNSTASAKAVEDEAQSLRDIDAQLSFVVNVLVSVIACGITFFLLLGYTRWSNETKTLASLFGALVVGLAEVVLYASFVRRLGKAEGKKKDNGGRGKRKERRRVEGTWVIEAATSDASRAEKISSASKTGTAWEPPGAGGTRQRKG